MTNSTDEPTTPADPATAEAVLTSDDYQAQRGKYWAVQRAFRDAAVAEMRSLVREHAPRASAVLLSINDAMPPRLSVDGLLDAPYVLDGDGHEMLLAELDQIASDMEVFDWDEADSFLDEHGFATGSFCVEVGP